MSRMCYNNLYSGVMNYQENRTYYEGTDEI